MLVFGEVYVVVVEQTICLRFLYRWGNDPIHPGGYCDSVWEHLKEVYKYNTKVWIDGMFKIPNKNPKKNPELQNQKKNNFWGQEIPLKSCGYFNAGKGCV